MTKVACVRFRDAGKVYYFDPKDLEITAGCHVIVETARGTEMGSVVGGLREIDETAVSTPLKPVLRVATREDEEKIERNRQREKDAMEICREKIRKHELDMKLIDAEYAFDNSKILFYFTADGRIDFRDLVKDLASVFRMRIELRQIGVRDETKLLGGVGICGRALCCHTWLTDFVPVSIRMAKEQNLSLNPTKISGVCGRLMCCLKNEEETYEYLNSQLPAVGETVTTDDGMQGEVASISVLRQKVKVLVDVDDEKEMREYDVAELSFRPRRRKNKNQKGGQENRRDGQENQKGGQENRRDGQESQKGGQENRRDGQENRKDGEKPRKEKGENAPGQNAGQGSGQNAGAGAGQGERRPKSQKKDKERRKDGEPKGEAQETRHREKNAPQEKNGPQEKNRRRDGNGQGRQRQKDEAAQGPTRRREDQNVQGAQTAQQADHD